MDNHMASLNSYVNSEESKSRSKGWMFSFVTHLVLVALLFLPMLTQTPPPEEEEGVVIALGLPDEGQGEETPLGEETQPEPEPAPQQKEVVKKEMAARTPQKQVSSKLITNNEQDDIKVREAEAKKQATADAQRKAAAEAERQEAYNKTKKSYGDLLGGGSKGNTGKSGSQGDPNGDPNAKALEGISKGSGRVGGGLGNRGVLHEPQISDKSQKTGRVVISVCVDKAGKVIKADYTQKGSTTTDSELKEIARKAALQFKFTTADIEEQCGTITVDFKVQ
ncbi:MAG: hypothetical protein M3R25_00600 [Bacteroidota bacterium]|nr:hypothetical protein [Bacteroidota bacterium]